MTALRTQAWLTTVLAAALVTGCTAAPTTSTSAPTTSASSEVLVVISIADGDTFTGRDAGGAKVKVRMLSIDAPEVAHNGKPAACGAAEAAARLHGLILGKTVRLVADARADDVDQYQRRLRYVELDGTDVALAMINAGLVEAWYPKSEPRPQRYDGYAAAAAAARGSGVGSWRSCDKLGR